MERQSEKDVLPLLYCDVTLKIFPPGEYVCLYVSKTNRNYLCCMWLHVFVCECVISLNFESAAAWCLCICIINNNNNFKIYIINQELKDF